MLIGLSGRLTGYDGTFAFDKPGDVYGEQNYLGMRLFCATLGLMIIPFCYIAIWELSHSLSAAFLASCFIIFGAARVCPLSDSYFPYLVRKDRD